MEEKLTFFAALAIAGEKRQIRFKSCAYGYSYYVRKDDKAVLLDEDAKAWWPSITMQTTANWEVEPDDIIVYGVCDADGASGLFIEEPILDEDKSKWIDGLEFEQERICMGHKGLFPKDKPRKFKLVEVKD